MYNYRYLLDAIFTCTFVLASYRNRNHTINAYTSRIDFWQPTAYAWAVNLLIRVSLKFRDFHQHDK